MNAEKSLPTHTILEGKVHVFMRDGSPFWWGGFHFKGKYLRTSTKQVNSDAADAMASQWYFKKQTEIASGQIATPKHAFDKLAEDALTSYKGLVTRGIRSQKTLDGIEGILKSRIMPYFKKMPVINIDNTTWHRFKEDMVKEYPAIKRGTLHQYKNGIRVVLNQAYKLGYIKELPVFKDEYTAQRIDSPRPWFDSAEYNKLHHTIMAHAKRLQQRDRLLYEHAMELYDYVIFSTNTGMRVGEMKNLKVADVKIVTEQLTAKEVLIISNIKGKRGTGTCQSFYGAVAPFKRILERRKIAEPSKCQEPLFLIHHRTMFNKVLVKADLKISKTSPPCKRDFVSLRATYICFRLLNGVPIYEIANNCRTSVAVIQESYARHLGRRLMPNINRMAHSMEGWDY
jgi:integrase